MGALRLVLRACAVAGLALAAFGATGCASAESFADSSARKMRLQRQQARRPAASGTTHSLASTTVGPSSRLVQDTSQVPVEHPAAQLGPPPDVPTMAANVASSLASVSTMPLEPLAPPKPAELPVPLTLPPPAKEPVWAPVRAPAELRPPTVTVEPSAPRPPTLLPPVVIPEREG